MSRRYRLFCAETGSGDHKGVGSSDFNVFSDPRLKKISKCNDIDMSNLDAGDYFRPHSYSVFVYDSIVLYRRQP